MICKWCAEAADTPIDRCSVCHVGPIYVYNDQKPREEQKVYKHKKRGARPGQQDYWCTGSLKPPVDAHAMCNGCTCQHRPIKEGYVNEEGN